MSCKLAWQLHTTAHWCVLCCAGSCQSRDAILQAYAGNMHRHSVARRGECYMLRGLATACCCCLLLLLLLLLHAFAAETR